VSLCHCYTCHTLQTCQPTSPLSTTAGFVDNTAVLATDSDPAIASHKLQTNLLSIQNLFKKWRMKVNGYKSIHVTFTTGKETCSLVHINNVQVSQEDVKYLGLHLDRRFTWNKHVFVNWKQLGIALTKMYWLLGCKSKLSTSSKLLNQSQTNLDLCNTTLGYAFHFQHRNSTAFPIESLVHDSGRTLVCAKYGYRKGSPNSNS
jgi:hypothetical protein